MTLISECNVHVYTVIIPGIYFAHLIPRRGRDSTALYTRPPATNRRTLDVEIRPQRRAART